MGEPYAGHPKVAVGAVVYHAGKVLMVKRRDPPNAGCWAIPGGSIDLGETLQQAAEREIREETGVDIQAGKPIYIFDVIDRDDQGKVRYHYVITDLEAEYVAGEPHGGDDALQAAWLTPEEVRELPLNSTSYQLLVNELRFGA